jgi:hypothetical protein
VGANVDNLQKYASMQRQQNSILEIVIGSFLRLGVDGWDSLGKLHSSLKHSDVGIAFIHAVGHTIVATSIVKNFAVISGIRGSLRNVTVNKINVETWISHSLPKSTESFPNVSINKEDFAIDTINIEIAHRSC